MATQKAVGLHLDLSQAAVSQLAAAGVFKPRTARGGLNLDDCRVAYVRHLREQAAGRAGSGAEKLNLVDERAALARAQRVKLERENAEAEEQLIDMDQAGDLFFAVAREARDAWLNWPSRVSPVIAAQLDIPIAPLLAALDAHVHQQVADLGEKEFTDALAERAS